MGHGPRKNQLHFGIDTVKGADPDFLFSCFFDIFIDFTKNNSTWWKKKNLAYLGNWFLLGLCGDMHSAQSHSSFLYCTDSLFRFLDSFFFMGQMGKMTELQTFKIIFSSLHKNTGGIYLANRGRCPLKDLHLISIWQTRVHGQNSQVFLHAISWQRPRLLLQEGHHFLHLFL